MTRKRFIKLLMSYGYSRNVAEYFAESVKKMNIPYKDATVSSATNLLWYVYEALECPTFYQGR